MPYDLQPNIWILAKYIRSGPKGSKPLASHARRRRLGFSLSHEDIGNRGKSWRSLASLYKWINGPLIERAFWPVQRCSVAGKKSEQSTKKCHGGSQRDIFFFLQETIRMGVNPAQFSLFNQFWQFLWCWATPFLRKKPELVLSSEAKMVSHECMESFCRLYLRMCICFMWIHFPGSLRGFGTHVIP
jgi:hypothetical protein